MTPVDQIVVYQPGKVGSSALMFALQRNGFDVRHVHSLCKTRLSALEKRCLENDEVAPPYVGEARQILRDFIEPKKRLHFVSAVRDPVARNLSAFFENIDSFCPNWRQLSKGDPNAIVAQFLKNYPHHVATDWFDAEFKGVLGIDVYQHPFSHELGYGAYSSDMGDAIILRAEDSNKKKSAALAKFLDVGEITIKEENKGRKRHWGDVYRKIKKAIRFPAAYLDQMYDSRMAKYFYTDQERIKFRQRHAQVVE